MEHTPGPWVAGDNEMGDYTVWEGTLEEVGDVLAAVREEANAHLMDASPDLLAACVEFVRKVDEGTARSVKSYAQMKAAIAKATTP